MGLSRRMNEMNERNERKPNMPISRFKFTLSSLFNCHLKNTKLCCLMSNLQHWKTQETKSKHTVLKLVFFSIKIINYKLIFSPLALDIRIIPVYKGLKKDFRNIN